MRHATIAMGARRRRAPREGGSAIICDVCALGPHTASESYIAMSATQVSAAAGASSSSAAAACMGKAQRSSSSVDDVITLQCGPSSGPSSGELKVMQRRRLCARLTPCVQVDREALCSHSRFFSEMLSSCVDTTAGVVKVDECL